MKFAPIPAIPSQNTAATINSDAIPTQNVLSVSAQAVATGGTVAGTVKFQASNDNVVIGGGNVPTNWTDIASATVSVTGAGSFLIPKTEICYQWVRVVYTNSGTGGTIAVMVKTIGF